MSNNKPKLSRRQFAGAVAAAVAAPTLLGGVSVPLEAGQVQKKPKGQAGVQEEEDWLTRGRKALREFPVPAETEPAFVFRARGGGRHGK